MCILPQSKLNGIEISVLIPLHRSLYRTILQSTGTDDALNLKTDINFT